MKFKFTDWSFLDRQIEAVESYLKKAHEQFKQTTVLHEALNYASKNFPHPEDETFESCLTTIRAYYGKLKNEVSIKLQGGVQQVLGAANMATANQNIGNKEKELQAEADKKERLAVDRGRIFINGDQTSYKKQQTRLIIFAIGECLWTVSAFLKLGDILIIALCLGIVIGLAQISVVKSATQIIKEIDDRKKRKVYTIVAVAAFFALSWLLALLRYWFIHQGSATGIPFIVMNPLTFVAINMLFIAATALIVIFHYPGKSQIDDIAKADKLDKEIQAADVRCRQLNTELTGLLKEREFFAELRIRLSHAEKKLHEKVNKMFDEAVGAFKNENVAKRKDKTFPQSFKNPHAPLSDESIEHVQVLEN
ncbi:MAG: hypothetical protein JWQ38_346 [Flavipsychrobacter sp.]|nr:hypothetical protein [Flavipsychrobacter sp.]